MIRRRPRSAPRCVAHPAPVADYAVATRPHAQGRQAHRGASGEGEDRTRRCARNSRPSRSASRDYRKCPQTPGQRWPGGLIAAAVVFLICAQSAIAAAHPGSARSDAHPVAPAKRSRLPAPAPRRRPAPSISAFVDEIVARSGRKREAAIPLLQAIQTHYRYLPDEALRRLCETHRDHARADRRHLFVLRAVPPLARRRAHRQVCHGTACHVAGARQITDELRRHLHIPEGEDTDPPACSPSTKSPAWAAAAWRRC